MPDLVSVPDRVRAGSNNCIQNLDDWQRIHDLSLKENDEFWLDITHNHIAWSTLPTIGMKGSFETIEDGFTWFSDGKLNATVSCLDQHLHSRRDKTAILWEGDEPDDIRRITYWQLHQDVCRFSNALTSLGVKSGDRVIIYFFLQRHVTAIHRHASQKSALLPQYQQAALSHKMGILNHRISIPGLILPSFYSTTEQRTHS